MTTVTDTQYQYIGDQNTDGLIIGKTSTVKLAFYGGTPAVLSALSNPAVSTTSTTVMTTWTSSYGFSTSTATLTVVNLLNEIRAKLVSLGLTS